jgi:Zn-dependent protease
MPESSDRTTEFPAFRIRGGSIDDLSARLETPLEWRWCGIGGIDDVEMFAGPDRGEGAMFRVFFANGDPSTCEGEVVASERSAEVGFAAVELRLTPGESNEEGCVLLRVDVATHANEVACSYRLREESDPGDAAIRAFADRLRALLHWTNGPAFGESGHRVTWTIEAAPEAVFETLLRPHRWSEWIVRATEGRVARDGTLPPPPEIPRLAFEPWSASGELDRSDGAMGDPDATISAETPWRLIDPAGEGPAPTILLRTIDPGRSVEFMLVWRDAAALDPEAAELDPDEPRCHLRIDLVSLDTAPWIRLAVSSRCTPPQTQQRLGRLGTLLKWLSSTDCAKELTAEETIEVEDRLRTIHSHSSDRSGRSFYSGVRLVAAIACLFAFPLFVVGSFLGGSVDRPSEAGVLTVFVLSLVWARLIHELGHAIAMHLTGYRDDRMFLLFPFTALGGADSGRHFNEPGWKAAVVALAGPLPGIALVVGVIAWYRIIAEPTPWWLDITWSTSGIVNAFPLVPIMPLDGGRVVRAIVARRLPWLEFWIFLLVLATLLAGALLESDWVLLAIGVGGLVYLPSFRQTRITARLLREGYRPVARKDGRISWTGLGLLVDRIGKVWPRLTSLRRSSPEQIAEMAIEQYERLSCRPPGLALSAVFLLAQFGAILLWVFVTRPQW